MSRSLVVACALGGLCSCKVYDESLLLDGPDSGLSPDAYGNGVGWWSGPNAQTQCTSASLPTTDDRPQYSSSQTISPLVFALRTMRLGSRTLDGTLDPNAWYDLGFDLDQTCTRSPTCDAAEPFVSCRSLSTTLPNDGNYCRDNTFGRLEYMVTVNPDISGPFRLDEARFNCSICQGAYNILIRLSDYNGESNDSSVRVDVFPSPGIETLKDIDCTQTVWDAQRCWTAQDAWYLQDSVLTDVAALHSKLYDPSAFVRNSYLVMRLPDNQELSLPGNRAQATAFPLKLQHGLVTAKLTQNEQGSWSLSDGVIAGAMKTDDILEGFNRIGLCKDNQLYTGISAFVRTWADILSTVQVSPDAQCDALSVGIGFSADQAALGSPQSVPSVSPCDKADGGS